MRVEIKLRGGDEIVFKDAASVTVGDTAEPAVPQVRGVVATADDLMDIGEQAGDALRMAETHHGMRLCGHPGPIGSRCGACIAEQHNRDADSRPPAAPSANEPPGEGVPGPGDASTGLSGGFR